MPSKKDLLLHVALPAVCLLPFLAMAASTAYGTARVDWRYQVAGMADPFLGRPAPLVSIVIGLVVSLGVSAIAAALHRSLGPSPDLARGRPLVVASWVVLLVAGWGGYAAGAASVLAAGGPADLTATLRWQFGAPLNSVGETSGICRTVVGRRDMLAGIEADYLGLPVIHLRDPVTEKKVPTAFVPAQERWTPAGQRVAFEPVGVPVRPRPYLMAGGDAQKPISFLQAYSWRASRVVETGLTGTADLTGTRWADPYGGGSLYWVDLVMSNDPWPPTFTLSVTWTCSASG